MTRYLACLFLSFSFAGTAFATTYKWIDEQGNVHYCDRPPADIEAELMVIPEAPPQQKLEQESEQVKEEPDKQSEMVERMILTVPRGDATQEIETGKISLIDVVCFEPLSELVHGTSGHALTPITTTLLSGDQQKKLVDLFSKLKGRWRGTMSEVRCMGKTADPVSQTKTGEARTSIHWDRHKAQLTFETEFSLKSYGKKPINHKFEVGNALYFIGADTTTLAFKRNETEILTLNESAVSFLTKRLVPRPPCSQVTHLEKCDKTFILIELYYTHGILVGKRDWVLRR